MNLKVLDGFYKVVKISEIPIDIFNQEFYSITKTDDEVSIVVNENVLIESDSIETGFKIIKVLGVLDFSLIGILSKISTILANNKISIFVISTYNTDYILLNEKNIVKAKQVL